MSDPVPFIALRLGLEFAAEAPPKLELYQYITD